MRDKDEGDHSLFFPCSFTGCPGAETDEEGPRRTHLVLY